MKNHHKKLKTCCVGIDCSGINILEQMIRENVPMYAYVAIESEKQQFRSFEKKKILIRCDEWPDSETNPDISENILISNTTKKEIKQCSSQLSYSAIWTLAGYAFHNACILYHVEGDLSRGFLNFFANIFSFFVPCADLVHCVHE